MKLYTKLLFTALAIILFIADSRAQLILLEDFENGIPSTWMTRDLDGLTPFNTGGGDPTFDGQQFTVGEGWFSREDPFNAGNGVALSHSWYTTLAPSDDWLITPAVTLTANVDLKWTAATYSVPAYRDGYEVLISTTDTAVASFNANPALFTTAAEAGGSYTVNLSAYAGQTVYIAFRNNSLDKYMLSIDDVILIDGAFSDGSIVSLASDYSLMPLKHATSLTTGSVDVANVGDVDLTNARVKLTITKDAAVVFTDSTTLSPATLPVGDTVSVGFSGNYVPTDTGFYVLQYVLSSDLDFISGNNVISEFVYVNDTMYGRDLVNEYAGRLGVSDATLPDGLLYGSTYEVVQNSVLTSVDMIYILPKVGDSSSVSVFNINNGVPGALIATSNVYYFTADTFQNVLFTFPTNVVLAPDTYLVAVRQYSDTSISIYGTFGKFQDNTHFIGVMADQTTVGNWLTYEAVGFDDISMYLRPSFGECSLTIDSSFVQQPSCPDRFDGLVVVYATGNNGSALTYEWSNSSTTSTADFLNAGVYTVTIEDGLGCKSVASYNLATVAPIVPTITIVNASTATATDGSASVAVTGGTPPYSYAWSTSDVSDAVSGLGVGAISVTVTDANGCDKVARDTVEFGVGIFTPANDLAARIYPNPAASQVFVEVTLAKAGDVEIVVMNNLGQAVIRQTETATQVVSTALNISSLPAGIYLVQISSGDANTVQKLIVE